MRLTGRKRPAANRAFFVFGEHSRELITVESGIHLLKSLCSGARRAAADNYAVSEDLESLVQNALRDTEFRMVLNANPKSRREVEQGKFCKRTDENDVDLNRNWDFHWDKKILDVYGEKLNPGSKPFSEPESHALWSLVKSFKPTSFLSIHSGNLGMYTPWAYDPKAGEASAEMTELLESTQREYCKECAYGSASKHIGYSSPGTSVDWAFGRGGARYSYAFEIYVGSGRNSTDVSMLEASQLVAGAAGAGGLLAESAASRHGHQLRQALAAGEKANKFEAAACFFRYNPSTEAERAVSLQRWTKIYLSMAGQIATKVRDEQIDEQI